MGREGRYDEEQTKACSDRLNAFLCGLTRKRTDLLWLASPLTGGGVHVNSGEQLFLESIKLEQQNHPAEWARYAWRHFAPLGAKVLKDGKPLETEEESLAELERQAGVFQEKRLPILKALGIA